MKKMSLKGKILISEPFLPDPNFTRGVVLLTEDGEDGSVGYVLNQATDLKVSQMIEDLSEVHSTVYVGGPVQMESFHYLHRYEDIQGAVEVMEGVNWSGDFKAVIEGLKDERYLSSQFKFFVGYSGWSPGQLAAELEEGSWIVSTVEADDIFKDEGKNFSLWKKVVRHLGGDDSLLANSPKDPYLN